MTVLRRNYYYHYCFVRQLGISWDWRREKGSPHPIQFNWFFSIRLKANPREWRLSLGGRASSVSSRSETARRTESPESRLAASAVSLSVHPVVQRIRGGSAEGAEKRTLCASDNARVPIYIIPIVYRCTFSPAVVQRRQLMARALLEYRCSVLRSENAGALSVSPLFRSRIPPLPPPLAALAAIR